MTDITISSLITAVASLLGVMLSNLLTERKRENTLRTAQAVTDTKLDALAREVREHNNFAKRMPVVEEQLKALDHRVNILEERLKHFD